MNAHQKRWITAAVAVPVILILIVYCSEAVFALFITALVLSALAEYGQMVFGKGMPLEKSQMLAAGILLMASAYFGDIDTLHAVITFTVLGAFILFLLRIRQAPSSLDSLLKIVFGVFYIALTMSFFILTRSGENGRIWIFFLIILAFANDVSAFYVGRTWGKRKLIPLVSAGKTVEGSIAGILGAIVACSIYFIFFFKNIPVIHAVILGLIGSIFGQLGDLCESTIKRVSRVKDSGTFFPGHGGILDRLDAFIFIVPFVYFYKLFIL
ncbi:MAG: phosphatidate cytidylyltransferase [Syntrophales bacterium]|jgi:phosphatidate cytidylyltransferase|nr:phosphatidate cytidylyltransferase [Syntrophales bacterium]MDY0043791.1 phosphatidate cytidylyltransferase [Syntrophales bacterium]